MVGNPELITDHTKLHRAHILGWTSSRIPRVVRSTLSAEAYGCSDAADSLMWSRSVFAEILNQNFDPKQYEKAAYARPAAIVTDCKSLFDTVVMELSLIHI